MLTCIRLPCFRVANWEPDFCRLLVVLSISQLVGWGTLYYAFSLFVDPIHQSLGWSRAFLSLAMTLALIAWGLAAPAVSALIAQSGGRQVMAAGSAIAGISLSVWALLPHNRMVFLSTWVLLGVSMAAVLYEAAFAVLVQKFKECYREAITLLAIIGGLASTIFIPLIHLAIGALGWEKTIWLIAYLNLLVCVPIHYFFLPDRDSAVRQEFAKFAIWPNLSLFHRPEFDRRIFAGLVVWFSAFGITTSTLSVLLIPVLMAMDVEKSRIVLLMTLVGPMQIAGRVVMWRTSVIRLFSIGIFVVISLSLAIVLLLLLPHLLVSLIVLGSMYGLSKGLMTIVKGCAVAELMPLRIYAETNGWITLGQKLTQALTPVTMAGVWHLTRQPETVLWLTAIIALSGLVGIRLLKADARWV